MRFQNMRLVTTHYHPITTNKTPTPRDMFLSKDSVTYIDKTPLPFYRTASLSCSNYCTRSKYMVTWGSTCPTCTAFYHCSCALPEFSTGTTPSSNGRASIGPLLDHSMISVIVPTPATHQRSSIRTPLPLYQQGPPITHHGRTPHIILYFFLHRR